MSNLFSRDISHYRYKLYRQQDDKKYYKYLKEKGKLKDINKDIKYVDKDLEYTILEL